MLDLEKCPICLNDLETDFPDFLGNMVLRKCFVKDNHSVYYYVQGGLDQSVVSIEISDLNTYSYIFDYESASVRVMIWKSIGTAKMINFKSFDMEWFEPIFDLKKLQHRLDIFSAFC